MSRIKKYIKLYGINFFETEFWDEITEMRNMS